MTDNIKDKVVEELQKVEHQVEEKVMEEVKGFDYSQYMPAAQEFGTGSIFGACAGVFSRAAARFAMVSFGGFFVALQLLQNTGYINVEWKKMENDMSQNLDLNNDGKLDQEDAKIAYERYLKTLTYKLPSTGGFAFAFLLGFRGKILGK